MLDRHLSAEEMRDMEERFEDLFRQKVQFETKQSGKGNETGCADNSGKTHDEHQ